MKLNLLPTYVSKASAAKTATILSVLLGLIGIVGAVGLIMISRSARDEAYNGAQGLVSQYTAVDKTTKEADAVIASAQQLMINQGLAEAMMKHNTKYPDLYDEVRRYVPGFLRVTSMAIQPSGPDACVVTINGVLQTQQQYADAMMALLRIPGATNVTRSGYGPVDKRVPSLIETDQIGLPVEQGAGNIPSDAEGKLNYLIGQGSVSGFDNAGGFGTEPGERGPMPEWSAVTYTVALPRQMQTPDPRATLVASPAGNIAAPTPAGGAAPAPAPGRGGARGGDDGGAPEDR